jgi:ADP-ribosylglycohydrolase
MFQAECRTLYDCHDQTMEHFSYMTTAPIYHQPNARLVCTSGEYRQHPVIRGLAEGDTIGGPTAIASVLAASVIDTGRYDPQLTADRYLDWWRAEGFDTGPVFALVMAARIEGASTEQAVLETHKTLGGQSGGCNPAHRAPALAVVLDTDLQELVEAVIADAALTHQDPLAGDVAAAVAVLCRVLMDGASWEEAKAVAADGRLPETVAAITWDGDALPTAGGYAPEVLAAAVYFLDRYPLEEALTAAKAVAGEANYCPVIVGAVGGAMKLVDF